MILDLHDLFATDTPCGLDSGTKRLVLFDPSSAPRLRFRGGLSHIASNGVLSWAAAGATAHFSSVVVEPSNATTDSACSAVPQGKSEAEGEGGPAAVRLTVREGYAALLQPPRPLCSSAQQP